MQDVFLKQYDNGFFDIVVEDGNIVGTNGLDSAVYVSVGTDARAEPSQVQSPGRRRGWMGELLESNRDQFAASLLWTLEQARLTQNTINIAESFIVESMQLLTDQGAARNIYASAEKTDVRSLRVNTTIESPEGETNEYRILWRNTSAS